MCSAGGLCCGLVEEPRGTFSGLGPPYCFGSFPQADSWGEMAAVVPKCPALLHDACRHVLGLLPGAPAHARHCLAWGWAREVLGGRRHAYLLLVCKEVLFERGHLLLELPELLLFGCQHLEVILVLLLPLQHLVAHLL